MLMSQHNARLLPGGAHRAGVIHCFGAALCFFRLKLNEQNEISIFGLNGFSEKLRCSQGLKWKVGDEYWWVKEKLKIPTFVLILTLWDRFIMFSSGFSLWKWWKRTREPSDLLRSCTKTRRSNKSCSRWNNNVIIAIKVSVDGPNLQPQKLIFHFVN